MNGPVHVAISAFTLLVIGAGLAVARPHLLALSLQANEAQAVADLLEFGDAEDRFATGFGAYGAPESLADPRRSPLPGVTMAHPRFLSPVRNGYRFVFQGDTPSARSPLAAVTSRTFQSYTYVAFPVVPARTGQRSFMYESQGRVVHARTDGGDPRPLDPIVATR